MSKLNFSMNKDVRDFKTVDVCYQYDGSFYGMLSCVFESFEKKEIPLQVTCDDFSLFNIKYIQTDEIKAERILASIPQKINRRTLDYVKCSYLANIKAKEIALIHFLREGYKRGKRYIDVINTGFSPSRTIVAGALENDFAAKIQKGVDLLALEAHRFVQFIRFSDVGGALVGIIEPEHNVLPLMVEHFTDRYPNENFLIYDKNRQFGLIYTDRQVRIEHLESYQLPALSQEEKNYQNLWRLFYDTVAIKERRNERCRMNFMPKKYWKNMTEFLNN